MIHFFLSHFLTYHYYHLPKLLLDNYPFPDLDLFLQNARVSGAGEPPPCALSDTDVNLWLIRLPSSSRWFYSYGFAFFTGSSHKMVDL